MRRILFLLVLLPQLSFAQEVESPVFNPDFDGDGCYFTNDLIQLLCLFGTCEMENMDADPGFHPYFMADSCYSAFDLLPFLALFETCTGSEMPWTCGDPMVHDNMVYGTMEWAGECWFMENLNGASYANGDPVDAVLPSEEWPLLSTGATVIYGEGEGACTELSPLDACDEQISQSEYGRLYNGYAVADARGLCPSGWHVSSDADWDALETALGELGYVGQEGAALKASEGWYNSGNGSDILGFTAVPGGYRFKNNGLFLDAGASSYFWTSTDSGGELWYRYMNNGNLDVGRYSGDMRGGFSVRCVQD